MSDEDKAKGLEPKGNGARRFFSARVRPWNLVKLGGLLCCLATATGFLGSRGWLLDLTSHFRLQYGVTLVLLAALFGIRRDKWWTRAMAAFAVVNLAVITPCYVPTWPVTAAAGPRLRLALINVHTENQRYEAVEQFIRQSQPSILVLEEIDAVWLAHLTGLRAQYPYAVVEAREDNFGIALFSRLPVQTSEVVYPGGSEVPSIRADVKVRDRLLTVLATHAVPPANAAQAHSRDRQLAALPAWLNARTGPLVLLGDLNATPWSHSYRRLLNASGLIDSARGQGLQPTWPSFAWPVRIPIDHCLVSPDVAVMRRWLGPDVGSDHLPLVVDIMLGPE